MRVVVDTNVMISALLFGGRASILFDFIKDGACTLVASKEILKEYLRTLAYPKFGLSETEIRAVFTEEIVPLVEPVEAVESGIKCRDDDDKKFLDCATTSGADALVTGDKDLLILKGNVPFKIYTIDEILAVLSKE